MERLKTASDKGFPILQKAAQRDKLFLKNVPFDTSLHTDFQRHAQDEVANTLMANFVASNQVALRSTADGGCSFNSVSTLLCGSESRTTELRYRCCIYMVLEKSNIMINRHYKKVTVIFPQINTDCLNCARPGTYSSMHMFIAMSLLLNIPIKVYPAVNGSKNYNFKVMNLSEESKEKREHKFFNDKGNIWQNQAHFANLHTTAILNKMDVIVVLLSNERLKK